MSDFRFLSQFQLEEVSKSGKNIGKTTYWKLYAIENIFRVIINSILSVQINQKWWDVAVDSTMQKKAANFKSKYIARPWHTTPGKHDVYYIDLCDLGEIIRVNSHLFEPLIPDIDQWIVKIEGIRLPRNIVAHMNFPNTTDQSRIGILYDDVVALSSALQTNNLTFQIP